MRPMKKNKMKSHAQMKMRVSPFLSNTENREVGMGPWFAISNEGARQLGQGSEYEKGGGRRKNGENGIVVDNFIFLKCVLFGLCLCLCGWVVAACFCLLTFGHSGSQSKQRRLERGVLPGGDMRTWHPLDGKIH